VSSWHYRFNLIKYRHQELILRWDSRGRDCTVVGFTTTCEISAYHHQSSEFEPRSWRGVLHTTLCDTVCQWLVACRWFSLGISVSSTNKSYHHDLTEILLKVALNTINQPTILMLIIGIKTILDLVRTMRVWQIWDC